MQSRQAQSAFILLLLAASSLDNFFFQYQSRKLNDGFKAAGGLRGQLNRMPLQILQVQAVNGAAEGRHHANFLDLPTH